MTRAEQAAVERFPHGTFDGELGDSLRCACAFGYYKAEKDLALTWEDIQAIDNIIVDLAQHTDWPLRGQEVFYEEVLRRFREMKNK